VVTAELATRPNTRQKIVRSSPKNVIRKRRGLPTPGQVSPVTAIRLSAQLREIVGAWAAKQPDEPSRSEAIRRLIELGLTVKSKAKQPSAARAHRAKELARTTIEAMIDPSAPFEERAERRHQLTKGPAEFRGARIDLPKATGEQ
jgi:hypothetical protein